VGQEHLAILAAGLALGGRTEPGRAALELERVGQHRQVPANAAAAQCLILRNGEQTVGRAIGGQYLASAVDGQNGRGAALRQKLSDHAQPHRADEEDRTYAAQRRSDSGCDRPAPATRPGGIP